MKVFICIIVMSWTLVASYFLFHKDQPKLLPTLPAPITSQDCNSGDYKKVLDEVLMYIAHYSNFRIDLNGVTYSYKLINQQPLGDSK